MKKVNVFFFTMTLFALQNILAQAPQAMKYQAIARDNTGNIISNKFVSLRISILQGSISGTSVYTETHQNYMTQQFGLVDLSIGTGTVVTGDFIKIDWGAGIYFVKIEFDPNGGANYQFMGSSQLLSVPYALYANTAGTAGNSKNTYPNVQDLSNVSPLDMTWYQAADYCKNLNEKGFSDWYLPTKEELLLGFAVIEGISFTTDNLWTRSRSDIYSSGLRMEIMFNTELNNNANFPLFNHRESTNSKYKCRCVR